MSITSTDVERLQEDATNAANTEEYLLEVLRRNIVYKESPVTDKIWDLRQTIEENLYGTDPSEVVDFIQSIEKECAAKAVEALLKNDNELMQKCAKAIKSVKSINAAYTNWRICKKDLEFAIKCATENIEE